MSSFLRKSSFFFHKFLSIWSETEFELDCKNNHFQKIPCFLFSPFSYKTAPKLFFEDKKRCLMCILGCGIVSLSCFTIIHHKKLNIVSFVEKQAATGVPVAPAYFLCGELRELPVAP
jgi:hypothetical protein